MKITLAATGVSESALRELAAACSLVGAGPIQVALDGPGYRVQTPGLQPNQFAAVAARIVKKSGVPLADLLEGIE